jgi:HD-GYP domain-containing protein (c-di-GMP phosphodiesterase class II)/Tfp pilus assembly protein PilF
MLQANGANENLTAARSAEQQGEWDVAMSEYLRGLEEARAAGNHAKVVKILLALGRVHFERGEYDTANQRFLECLALTRNIGDDRNSASALNSMAVVAQFRGELEVAEPLYAQAEQIARKMGDDRLCAMIAQNLGTLANIRGDMPTALLRYQNALERFQKLNDDRASAWTLNNMGMLHVDVNELPEAELCFASAYTLAERQGDHVTQGKVDTNRADLQIRRQNFENARESCDRAFATFSRLGSHTGLGEVHRLYGMLHRETGRMQVAHVQFALALELAIRCENPLLEAETESERARVFLAERDHKRALVSLNNAYKIFCELEARREILDLRRRLDKLEEPYMQAIQLWAESEIEEIAPTRKTPRGRRVAEYGVALAKAAGCEDIGSLRVAAYLLDLGNAAIPADILDRPGPLSPEERMVVRQHAAIGEKLLREVGFGDAVLQIVRGHHERFDGSGYPDGLAGCDIPLGARVISIADYFDALLSERSFRGALDPATALVQMKAEAGKAFDPELLSTFFNLEIVRKIAFGTFATATPVVEIAS